MKKTTKKKPQDVAVITGNPNDQIVISPEDPPKKFQTEAIKLLKSKLKAPEFQYLAPTDRVDVENQNVDKQVKHIRKIVSKISTQQVTEEELNAVFSALDEAGRVGSILTSPIRAVGKIGTAAAGLGTAAVYLSTPETAAITTGLTAKNIAQRMAGFGTYTKQPKQSKEPSKKTTQAPKTAKPASKSSVPANVPMPPKLPLKDEPKVTLPEPTSAPAQKPRETVVMGKKYIDDTQQDQAKPATVARRQGGGKQPGVLSQSPSAVRRREQRAQKRAASQNIVSHREWDYENYLMEKLETSLMKKSERSGIDLDILSDVFVRGMESWNEECSTTQYQHAMQRVNSFISKGKTYFEEDKDLQEKSVTMGGRRFQQLGVGPRGIIKRKLMKLAGKQTLIKVAKTPKQKLARTIQRLKRKLSQKAVTIQYKKGLGEESKGLWANIHAKRARIKAGSGEKMRKPGSEGAPTKQNFIDAQEAAATPMKHAGEKPFKPSMEKPRGEWDSIYGKAPRKGTLKYQIWKQKVDQDKKGNISESFVVDRAAGYSTTYTAADLGIKIQGGFALHPSVVEEGGAGDEGTDKLVKKYKKDTPGEAVESLQRMLRMKRKANNQC